MAWNFRKALALGLAASASPAALLLRGEANGWAASFEHPGGSVCIRDAATPANDINRQALGHLLGHAVGAGGVMHLLLQSSGLYAFAPHNVCHYSQDFDNAAWTKTSCTVAANDIVAPDGTTTADKLTGNGAGTGSVGVSNLSNIIPLAHRTVWGVRAKAGSRTWIRVGPTSLGAITANCYFDLTNGALGTATGCTGHIEDAGDGWWLCWVELLSDVSDSQAGIQILMADGDGDVTVDRTSASYLWLWGGQINWGTTPCQYLPGNTSNSFRTVGLPIEYDVALARHYFLFEPAGLNRFLWNRDLTNAATTKTNVTATLDQTGIDGIANAATRLAATAADGTCLQAITHASTTRLGSAFVKRLVGTGAVSMTVDNGATWTVIAVTASWARVTLPVQTLADPTVGFKLATSGDEIAVDYVQCEADVEGVGRASSPIYVTTAATSRDADIVSWSLLPQIAASTEATVFLKFRQFHNNTNGNTASALQVGNGVGNNNQFGIRTSLDTGVYSPFVVAVSAGSTQSGLNIRGASLGASPGVLVQAAVAAKLNDYAASYNGAVIVTDTTSCAFPTGATLDTVTICPLTKRTTHIFQAVVVPRRVVDGELPTWRYAA